VEHVRDQLADIHHVALGLAYVVTSVGVGMAAVYAGTALGRGL
jgi:fluoride ion exporter CrcB/FEX